MHNKFQTLFRIIIKKHSQTRFIVICETKSFEKFLLCKHGFKLVSI